MYDAREFIKALHSYGVNHHALEFPVRGFSTENESAFIVSALSSVREKAISVVREKKHCLSTLVLQALYFQAVLEESERFPDLGLNPHEMELIASTLFSETHRAFYKFMRRHVPWLFLSTKDERHLINAFSSYMETDSPFVFADEKIGIKAYAFYEFTLKYVEEYKEKYKEEHITSIVQILNANF